MKVNILTLSVLTDVSAAALSARPIKKVEGGVMMRALQANQACEDEGIALGLCLGMYEDAREDAEACIYCPLNAVVDSGMDTCSSSDVAGFCALVESCGVIECHTQCLDELQAGADCIMREVGCDTCSTAFDGSSPADGTTATPATSFPEDGADAASGGVDGTTANAQVNPCIICPKESLLLVARMTHHTPTSGISRRVRSSSTPTNSLMPGPPNADSVM